MEVWGFMAAITAVKHENMDGKQIEKYNNRSSGWESWGPKLFFQRISTVRFARHAATPKYHVWSLPKFGSWNLSRSWDNKDYWEFLTPSTAGYLLATLQISSGGSNCIRRKLGFLAVSIRWFNRHISISSCTPGHKSIEPRGGGSWSSNPLWKRMKLIHLYPVPS